MSVSEELGTQREVTLPQGTIRYRESGSGDPIVFVHGVITNGDLWRKVVPPLSEQHRCIVPDWPLGSHSVPLKEGTDLSAPGIAQIIADFLAELDLRDVTLVGNDTGTAFIQILATRHPERIGRLVLTTGDAFRNFPPMAFKPLVPLSRVPGFITGLAQTLRPRPAQTALYRPLTKTLKDPKVFESFAQPAIRNAGVRRDLARVLQGLRSRHTVDAAKRLREFRKPVLLVWSPEDLFFPTAHANRLAELLPDARVELVEGSRTYISEDQPERLVELIEGFLSGARSRAAAAVA